MTPPHDIMITWYSYSGCYVISDVTMSHCPDNILYHAPKNIRPMFANLFQCQLSEEAVHQLKQVRESNFYANHANKVILWTLPCMKFMFNDIGKTFSMFSYHLDFVDRIISLVKIKYQAKCCRITVYNLSPSR